MSAFAANPVIEEKIIINDYLSFIGDQYFPCIAAKASMARQQIKCVVVDNIACPKDDEAIFNFLCDFVDVFKKSDHLYHSAAVIFKGPKVLDEDMFDAFLWQRLQALEIIDAKKYVYDSRVDTDTKSSNFSFSIKEEALYVIGLHSNSSRKARQFFYPTLVFNPHVQFEQLRTSSKYEMMKKSIRKRDVALSGSVNPMLQDFGEASEVFQYSGRNYDESWKCPLKITHNNNENNSTT